MKTRKRRKEQGRQRSLTRAWNPEHVNYEPKIGPQSAVIGGGPARRDLEQDGISNGKAVGFEAKDTDRSTRELDSLVEAGRNSSAGKAGEGMGGQGGRVCAPKGGTLSKHSCQMETQGPQFSDNGRYRSLTANQFFTVRPPTRSTTAAAAATAAPTKAPPKKKPQATKKKTSKTKSKKATPAAADAPIGDEGGLDAQGQNTAESQWIASVSTTSPSTTPRRLRAAADEFDPPAGERSSSRQEAVVQPHNTVSSRPKPCAGLRASTRNSPRGLPREDDFESDGRDHSVIFVDSDDKDPTLKLLVKKERHDFYDFNALEYHQTAEPPTPPRRRSMSPEYSRRQSSCSRSCSPAASRYSLPPPPSPDSFRHDSPHPQSIHHRHPRAVHHCHPPQHPQLQFSNPTSMTATMTMRRGRPSKKRAKTWQRNHGGRVSPSTESEDKEEDQAMEGEASAEPKSKTSRGKQKQKQKGKQKAVTAEVEVDGEEGEEDTERHKSGPIPAETKKCLNDLYDKFLQDVDGLAAECGKSSTSLHEELHFVAKLPRATSVWNMWQRYFAEKTPTDEKEKMGMNLATESRKSLIVALGPDFPPDKVKNTAAILKQLPWLIEFSEDLTEAAVNDLRKTGKLKTKLQRELLARYPASPAVRGSLQGDPEPRASIREGDDAKHNYRNITKKKCERGTGVHLVDVPDSDDAAGVPKRDAQLHNFTKIVSTQLWVVCDSAGTLSKLEKDTRKVKMVWNDKFIDRAREGEFRIVCYPAALEEADMIIGARKFSPKKIKASLFYKFLGKLAEGNRTGEMTGVMHFEFWSQDEMDLPLEDQGQVAVVQNAKGCPLVRVKDSDVWHKQVDAEAKKAKKAAEKAWKKVTKAMASKTRSELPPPPRLTFDTDNRGYPRPQAQPNSAWVPDRSINSPPCRSPPTRTESSRQRSRAPDAPPHQNEGPQYEYVNSYDSHYNPRYAPRHDPRYDLQHNSGYDACYAPSYDSRYDPCYDPRDRQYDGCYESPLRGPATHTATDGGHTEGKQEDRLAAHVGGAPREDRLAARVGGAPWEGHLAACVGGTLRDQEALGTGSTSGGKRKDMHDAMVEEAERDVKRSHLATEPVAALVKMLIIPGRQKIPENGRVFYVTRLEKTTIVGKADRYTFIHDVEKKNVATLMVDDAKGKFDWKQDIWRQDRQLRISLPARGNGTWDMGHLGKNMMGRPILWDKLRWDDPYNLCFSVV
ncbi:hypothetical protein DFH08DRAFT_824974 [Mycena albidolilacea]|uniref:Uncharacterized protein n=1 Tax=Mycena albidolilacea TaxID=1033008 RepID=A0AAD7E9Z1_9AGAR|nr:hypothetical protein DFH08DRAFT_824974 [Mycena albidolilacea]